MAAMRAGVIDVGSNTVRLLVAARTPGGFKTILSERTHLGLALDIERSGAISVEKLVQVGAIAGDYAARGRESGAERLAMIVTAPGRQSSNAGSLGRILSECTGLATHQLSAEDEARLAYFGAIAKCAPIPEPVGVIDVGGGSTQLTVGTAAKPAWLRSLDLGSLRLTERYVREDPPVPEELAALVDAVERVFATITPPIPRTVLATGGTARSLRRIAGRCLGAKELAAALGVLSAAPAAEVAAQHDLRPERARILPAGTIVLREAQRRLGTELETARGGVRDGVMLGLLDELAAAAA